MSATTLTLVTSAMAPACGGAPQRAVNRVLPAGDVVIGRASVSDGVVLLTGRNVLVRISHSGSIRRASLADPPGKLWGLGSIGDDLYSVAGFVDLVRLTHETPVQRVARYERPVANLVDLAEGLAAQPAVDHAGTPLLWSSDEAAHLAPIDGATRRSFGLPRAEEGVLHLLSCSAPARVICWLPGSDELFRVGSDGIRPAVRLTAVRRVAPARLITQPSRRAIHDAALTPSGAFVVLFDADGGDRPGLAEFDSDGKLLRWLDVRHRVRMLLEADHERVRVITSDGRLMEIPR